MEGRYKVRLPIKEDHDLPDNLALCKLRLASLLKRLGLRPEMSKNYNNVIQVQLKQGIIEPVGQGVKSGMGKVHNIPHHEGIHDDKETTKLQLLMTQVLEQGETHRYAGPPVSAYIYDVLLRFRINKMAITGDIEKAFLNVSVDPRDRDYLRFLWVNDVTSRHPNIQVYRFAFVVTSSPFLLKATIRHHLTSTDIPREFAYKVSQSLSWTIS